MKLLDDRATANKHRNTRTLVFGGGRRFTTRASHVNDAGSIDSPLMQSMENKIKEQLNAESVTVIDANGDGRHVSIDVVSSSFEGKSAVNRQRMVYKAIWEELQNTVHAVDQMTTKTPDEAATQK
jgi:stress-induced morphogen